MTDETQDAISALNEALAIGFETADFERLQGLYTSESVLVPPRSRPVKGRAAIAAFWGGVRNRFAGMVFDAGEVKLLAEGVARQTGTYDMAAGDGGQQSSGKYMFVWSKVDGAWQIDSSIWTRNPDQGQRQPGQGGGQHAGAQGGRAHGGGQHQPPQQGGYGRGGGQQGGYRQGGHGAGGARGGIAGQQGGIGGGGSGLGAGRRPGPQGGRRGPGGQGGGSQGGGRAQNLYDDNGGLYSNRDD